MSLSFFIINLIFGTDAWLVNIPYLTVMRLNVWRLVTSFFVNQGFLQLIFSGLMIWQISHVNEAEEGTARIILKYSYYHLAIQTAYALFGVVVVYWLFGVLKIFSAGFWAVYFVFLTIGKMKDPE